MSLLAKSEEGALFLLTGLVDGSVGPFHPVLRMHEQGGLDWLQGSRKEKGSRKSRKGINLHLETRGWLVLTVCCEAKTLLCLSQYWCDHGSYLNKGLPFCGIPVSVLY